MLLEVGETPFLQRDLQGNPLIRDSLVGDPSVFKFAGAFAIVEWREREVKFDLYFYRENYLSEDLLWGVVARYH